MPLYTFVQSIELEDDAEAESVCRHLTSRLDGVGEVLVRRWWRDLDGELMAAVAGVEWGGR